MIKNCDDDILIGDIWQLSRKAKGLTQEYVSEKLGLAPRYISDLERNKTNGSLRTLIKLCNLYQVTPTYILQDYLEINTDFKINPELIGFYSLNARDKALILNIIEMMNSEYKSKKWGMYRQRYKKILDVRKGYNIKISMKWAKRSINIKRETEKI